MLVREARAGRLAPRRRLRRGRCRASTSAEWSHHRRGGSARTSRDHRDAASRRRRRAPAPVDCSMSCARRQLPRRARRRRRPRQPRHDRCGRRRRRAPTAVVVCGGVDVFNPKCVRASAGALFFVPIVRCRAGRERSLESSAPMGPADRLGTSAIATGPYDDVDLTCPRRARARQRGAGARRRGRAGARRRDGRRSRSRADPSRSTWRPQRRCCASRSPASGGPRESVVVCVQPFALLAPDDRRDPRGC